MRKLDQASLPHHRDRISALDGNAPARWGGMDARTMVRHLRATVEMSLGEVEVPQLLSPVAGKPVGLLLCYVFTRWPKGKKGNAPPVPVLCPAPALPFPEEREQLLATFERFVARTEAAPREKFLHPIFGRMSLAAWSRLHEVHSRHHYRQFGVI